MRAHNLPVGDIEIGERQRALSEDAINRLAASMQDIGLKQPISIRIVDEMELDGELTAYVPFLVAGAHRLAAAKQLGWETIDCIEVDNDTIAAELWEIAENLHRCDLTKDQRDQHIRRYAELLVAQRQSCPIGTIESKRADGRGHRQQSVAGELVEKTGLSKQTVLRALNPKPRADPPKAVEDVHERHRSRLISAWNTATEEDRQWFRDWIDTPIMDARHAA